MAFEAGPQSHTFYACAEHKPKLEAGNVMCFLRIRNQGVEPVDPLEDMVCDFCREGGEESYDDQLAARCAADERLEEARRLK